LVVNSELLLLNSIESVDEVRQAQRFNSPIEFYNQGKLLLVKRQWQDSKDAFLSYQKFANAAQEGLLPPGFVVRDPHEDKHLEYLEWLQKRLDVTVHIKDEDGLFTIVPNCYSRPKEVWRKRYPFKKTN